MIKIDATSAAAHCRRLIEQGFTGRAVYHELRKHHPRYAVTIALRREYDRLRMGHARWGIQ